MTRRRSRYPAGRATEREVCVVAAVLEAGSEKAAAHRLGLSHSTVKHHLANARSKVGATTTAQLVWILAPRLPEPDAPMVWCGHEPVAARRHTRAPLGRVCTALPATGISNLSGAARRERHRATEPSS